MKRTSATKAKVKSTNWYSGESIMMENSGRMNDQIRTIIQVKYAAENISTRGMLLFMNLQYKTI